MSERAGRRSPARRLAIARGVVALLVAVPVTIRPISCPDAGSRLGPTRSSARSGQGEWARCIERRIRASGETWRSRSCPPRFRRTPIGCAALSRKQGAGLLNHPTYGRSRHRDARRRAYVVQELLEGRRAVAPRRQPPASEDDRRTASRSSAASPPRRDRHRPRRSVTRSSSPRWPCEDPRPRPRQAHAHRGGRSGTNLRRRPRERSPASSWNARLHVRSRCAEPAMRAGHLRLRRDPLRDALGKARLPGRFGRRDVGDPQEDPPISRDQSKRLARPRTHRPTLPREEPRAALRLGARRRVRPRDAVRRVDDPTRAVEGARWNRLPSRRLPRPCSAFSRSACSRGA